MILITDEKIETLLFVGYKLIKIIVKIINVPIIFLIESYF